MDKMRKLLFSVTRKDLRVDTFRAGGKGGQAQNKTNSGVRIVHPDSGAVGEARDSRHQIENKKSAFRRMVDSPKFQVWHKKKAAETLGLEKKVEQTVEDQMQDKNLLIEVRDENGNWIPFS